MFVVVFQKISSLHSGYFLNLNLARNVNLKVMGAAGGGGMGVVIIGDHGYIIISSIIDTFNIHCSLLFTFHIALTASINHIVQEVSGTRNCSMLVA